MATFKEWFEDFRDERGIECEYDPENVAEFTRMAEDYKWHLNKKQIPEAESIVEEFFENSNISDNLVVAQISESEVKCEVFVTVKHLSCKEVGLVEGYAESLISEKIAMLGFGNEFEVRVSYVATYDGERRISSFSRGEHAVDVFNITLDLELF